MSLADNQLDFLINNGMIRFRKYIKEAAESQKRIDDSFFAEGLTEALRSMDIKDFFSRAAMTDELKEFIREVLSRTYGIGGVGAILLDTVMGGGKTFSLLMLRNIFYDRSLAMQQDEIQRIVKNLSRQSIPEVELVIIDGRELDDRLDFKEQPLLKPFFTEGGTVGSVENKLKARDKPVVILIDELLEYFSKRKENFEKDLAYLRTLVEGVTRTNTSVIVITVPSDPADIEKYQKLQTMFKTLYRSSRIMRIAGGMKPLREILNKQIFEYIDPDAKKIALDFIKKYVDSFNKEDVEESYPFHPEVIEVFGRRFMEFQNYKKTRGCLIHLSNFAVDILRKVKNGQKFDTPFITLGDLDLSAQKEALTTVNTFNIRNLESVLDRDILPYKFGSLERKTLTAVYLYSLYPDRQRKGATSSQLSLALVSRREEDVETKLSSIINETMYLDFDKATRKYIFTGEPNLVSVVNKRAESVSTTDAWNQVKRMLGKLLQDDEINIVEPRIDEYKDGKLNVILIPYSDTLTDFESLWQSSNIDKDFENNTVIVFATDSALLDREAKKFVAVEDYEKEIARDKEKSKELMEKIKELKENIETNLMMRIVQAYSNVLFRQVGTGMLIQEKFDVRNDVEHQYLAEFKKCLTNAEKTYFSQDVQSGKLNCEELFKKVLGERLEYSLRNTQKDMQSGTALPFLTDEAFELAVQEVVEKGHFGLSDTPTSDENFDASSAEITIGRKPTSIIGCYILKPEHARKLLETSKKVGPVEIKSLPQTEERQWPEVFTKERELKSPYINITEKVASKEEAKSYIKDIKDVWVRKGKNFRISVCINSSGEAVLTTDISNYLSLLELIDKMHLIFSDFKMRFVIKGLNDEDIKGLNQNWEVLS